MGHVHEWVQNYGWHKINGVTKVRFECKKCGKQELRDGFDYHESFGPTQ